MIKCLILSVLLIVFLATAISFSNELFTQEERSEILNVIDNTCADSWCEGDFDYDFTDFKCIEGSGSCKLSIYFIDLEGKKSSLQKCNFFNITRIDQVLNDKTALSVFFYELLDECLSNLQSKLLVGAG